MGRAGGFERLDESVVGAEILVDFSGDRAGRLAAAIGLHRMPIKGVVPHLGGVVENTGLGGVAGDLVDDGFQVVIGHVAIGDHIVQIDHIGVVVFAMMIIEGVGGDMWLQRVFVIGQGRKFESHGASSRQVDHVIGRGRYPTRLHRRNSTKLI